MTRTRPRAKPDSLDIDLAYRLVLAAAREAGGEVLLRPVVRRLTDALGL